VAFFGDLQTGYKACLWLRCASRVLLVLARVDAHNAKALYAGVAALPWEEHVAATGSIAIDAHGSNDELRDSRFLALKTKDAICDRIREQRGQRPDVDREQPEVRINISLRTNKATVAIDLSGEPLHRRGYRVANKAIKAPLRETLAAAMLLTAGWSPERAQDTRIIDPLCGSGTIAIEAALIAADRAPGLLRSDDSWGFTHWLGHSAPTWEQLLDDADERADTNGSAPAAPCIFASDIDVAAVRVCQESAKRAGVASVAAFAVQDVAALRPQAIPGNERLMIVTNPPYGERLASDAQLPVLYAALAGMVGSDRVTSTCIITPDDRINAALAQQPTTSIQTYNGPLETKIRLYSPDHVTPRSTRGLAGESGKDETQSCHPALDAGSSRAVQQKEEMAVDDPAGRTPPSQLTNRLTKMAKHRAKWARRSNITCYRVYDADLPEYAVAIDLYEGAANTRDAGKRWLNIAEYAAPAHIDQATAIEHLNTVLIEAPAVLEVPTTNVYLKTRKRAKGGSQYSNDVTPRPSHHLISEGGLTFEVDFSTYLDTGIFLDHRPTRALLREMAAGQHCLNLFAYTGTASAYMAAGGAKAVTTVDLSQTYLDWAQRNMALNGFKGATHRYEQADVTRWVQEHRHDADKYGLIFIDPPTFSNSARMGKRTWDVQRDHAELLIAASRMLAKGGTIVFSTNLRSFKPDTETLTRAGVNIEDISARTIPQDFERNKRIHKCYLVKRTGASTPVAAHHNAPQRKTHVGTAPSA
jgi:23S rRNA (guanine2445-N2)-methyltransferase / 23S rRNA (guanine2069-N7)-methyltransferase